jgi:PKD repeat protein
LLGCGKDEPTPIAPTPIADFTYSCGNCEVNSLVRFSNSSQNADSYSWNFGDGNTSNQKDPTHIYTREGSYIVRLIATGKGGSNTVEKVVVIRKPGGGNPTKLLVKKVRITSYPPTTQGGSPWDITDALNLPDIYFKLKDSNGNVALDARRSKINNVDASDLPIAWSVSPNVGLFNANQSLTVEVWDADDLDSDDLMGTATFPLYSYPSFPATLRNASSAPSNLQVELDVEWQ